MGPSADVPLFGSESLRQLGGAASASAQNLSEIIVTAERRETTLQRTPISIIAFNEESMELRGIETLEDIAVYTPNLDIKGGRGFGNASPTFEIRGLSGGRRSAPASDQRRSISMGFSCRAPRGRS